MGNEWSNLKPRISPRSHFEKASLHVIRKIFDIYSTWGLVNGRWLPNDRPVIVNSSFSHQSDLVVAVSAENNITKPTSIVQAIFFEPRFTTRASSRRSLSAPSSPQVRKMKFIAFNIATQNAHFLKSRQKTKKRRSFLSLLRHRSTPIGIDICARFANL